MFICPEIEKVTDSTVSLLNRQVAYKDNDTNATFVEGNLIDKQGDDGKFYQFKSGYVGRDNSEPEWYAADTSLQFFGGSFQPIAYGTSKTIAEFAALIGVDITKNFTNTDSFYWTSRKLLEMISDYFFIVYSPGGLQFVIPKATGTDRGTVNKSDCIIRVKSSAVYNYAGESTGDIFIAANGEIQPVSITDAYKQMAVNKANAAANYMVFGSPYAYKCGDYVRSWDGIVYVILSGRRDNQTGLYEYTVVKEFIDSGAFAGADVTPVIAIEAEIGNLIADEALIADNVETFTGIGSEQTPINAVSLVAATDTDLIINLQDSSTTGDVTGLRQAWVKVTVTVASPLGVSTPTLYLVFGDTSGVTGGTICNISAAYGTVTMTRYLKLPFGRYTIRNTAVTAPASITLTVKYKDKKSSLTY